MDGSRIAVVTGGGSGVGLESARALAADGVHVVVTDIDEAAATDAADGIVAAGGSAEGRALDVADVGAIRETIAAVGREHGALHVLCNNAGVPGPTELDVDEAEFDRLIAVNVKSAYYASAAALPLLERAGGTAAIVMTASTSGVAGSSNSALYALTKGGLVLLTKSLALQLATRGVRVNAVCPTAIETPMLAEFFGRERGSDVEDILGRVAAGVPMGRAARPEEIGAAVAFLASERASFITGVALPVDGGFLAR